MGQNKKYYGNAVQAILESVLQKYAVGGEDNLTSIVKLLNAAVDLAFMWDLKEINDVCATCAKINSFLADDESEYEIWRKGWRYYIR